MVLFCIRFHSTGSASQPDMLPHGRELRGQHRLRSLGRGGGRTGIQTPCHHENDPTVNNVLAHGLEGANEKIWCDKKGSTVLWLQDLISESQPRSGRIMTSGYDANILWQNWNKTKTPNSEIGDNKCRIDRAPKTLGKRFDGNRDTFSGRDVDKDSQVISYCWGRQETQAAPNSFVATIVICKDVSYIGQDQVLQNSSQVSLERVIDRSSPNRAACSKYCEPVDFARYRRLQTIMKSFITLKLILSCPTIVSAAAIPTKCNLYSSNISTLPQPAFTFVED